ncbi:hypothetical protein [Halorhabdus sp. BNX81]|uniref:hypothetical protein n=1 Tax=Halorhabdus sp. BNX81 TaxID=2980181 RepID=UPI0023DD4FDF|nr:hypothetical protein [Halorhabdus sp. BNX81]WEL20867.1 hypothetical protein HBNXHr_0795 [Halorhabdus sp. BNX81]
MEKRIDLNDAFVSPFFALASGVQAKLFALVLFGFDSRSRSWIDNGPGGNKSGLAGARWRPGRTRRTRRAVTRVDSRGSREVRDVSTANVSQ